MTSLLVKMAFGEGVWRVSWKPLGAFWGLFGGSLGALWGVVRALGGVLGRPLALCQKPLKHLCFSMIFERFWVSKKGPGEGLGGVFGVVLGVVG